MDTLHAKAEWERVGERWFRKTQQYTSVFDESLDLDNYIVAGAPYGGALGKPSPPSAICAANGDCDDNQLTTTF